MKKTYVELWGQVVQAPLLGISVQHVWRSAGRSDHLRLRHIIRLSETLLVVHRYVSPSVSSATVYKLHSVSTSSAANTINSVNLTQNTETDKS